MTPKTNNKLSLGLAAVLCGVLVPSAIGASGELQTFQLNLHQGVNTLTVDPTRTVDPSKPYFKMVDIGECTYFGRYVNNGWVQIDMSAQPPRSLGGEGTLTAANGDSVGWILAVDPANPERVCIVPNTGTGRFEGATGYLENFPVSMTPNPNGTITIIHWAEGELMVPRNSVTRQVIMQAHSQMVLNLATGSFNSTAWINASHCGQSVGLSWGTGGVGAGKIIAANGDEIFFDEPTPVKGLITGGTGRFAGASGEFDIAGIEQTGMEPGLEPGTVTLYFVWTATGTITY
jgi:hypothetical protein